MDRQNDTENEEVYIGHLLKARALKAFFWWEVQFRLLRLLWIMFEVKLHNMSGATT